MSHRVPLVETPDAADLAAPAAGVDGGGQPAKHRPRALRGDSWVPYALVAHTPVYVYDHFGGPGYLTADNFDAAARFNFTGRCCERRLTGEELRRDILEGYARGVAFAQTLDAGVAERYRFEGYADALVAAAPRPSEDKRRALQTAAGSVERERLMAYHVRNEYIRLRRPSPR